MDKIILGRTDLEVSRTAFGALPIQRVTFEESTRILRKAFESGINFFDTARMYSDSEEKIGIALSDVRSEIVIATKSHAKDKLSLLEHLRQSLENLKCDYVDILQLHNPKILPDPNDENGIYQGLVEAKRLGLAKYIGITNHSLKNALEAAKSGLYDTVQFPLSYLSSEDDLKLIDVCKENNVGLIAMKALSGGLITNATAAFAFLRQYENVVPIWGMQYEKELDEFINLSKTPPELNDYLAQIIEKDRNDLAGDFCRGCGYCLPCPAKIEIPTAARISLLLNRAPYQNFMADEFKEKMERIENCIACGHCTSNCPYQLNTPELLKRELKYYNAFYQRYINKELE
ncbi:MAG: aldo/keto reductase [Clostridiales bacterium]|nr:aldo/keto reductase [Clostridiales bacterium]